MATMRVRKKDGTIVEIPVLCVEGSVTSDEELIDARVDYTGKTWDSVGEHIRSVTSELSEQISHYINEVAELVGGDA